jgi:transporter family-2 protein
MTPYTFLLALGALAAGGCIALQASANSSFRTHLGGQVFYAAYFSICGTFITASCVLLLLRPDPPSSSQIVNTPWWNWIGGPLGALIVLAGVALTRELGAALFIALVVGGQLSCALVLDHFALLGLPHQPITLGRLIGVLLVLAGVICIKYL